MDLEAPCHLADAAGLVGRQAQGTTLILGQWCGDDAANGVRSQCNGLLAHFRVCELQVRATQHECVRRDLAGDQPLAEAEGS